MHAFGIKEKPRLYFNLVYYLESEKEKKRRKLHKIIAIVSSILKIQNNLKVLMKYLLKN